MHGGKTEESSLALACHHCNLHKDPNLTGIDPNGGAVVSLFNPRTQSWNEQFSLNGGMVIGRTPTGRATVRVLAMNNGPRSQLRIASR
jgi:hypothetical protein